VAFQVYPSEREAKRLKKDRKPIHTKVVLVDLSTGHKTEFEKVRRFAFSGEELWSRSTRRSHREPVLVFHFWHTIARIVEIRAAINRSVM